MADVYLAFMKDDYPILRMVLADAHKFPAYLELVYREVILKVNRIVAARLLKRNQAASDPWRLRSSQAEHSVGCFLSTL